MPRYLSRKRGIRIVIIDIAINIATMADKNDDDDIDRLLNVILGNFWKPLPPKSITKTFHIFESTSHLSASHTVDGVDFGGVGHRDADSGVEPIQKSIKVARKSKAKSRGWEIKK